MAYQLDPIGPDDRAGVFAQPEDDAAPPRRRGLLTTALTLLVMVAFAGALWFAYREGRGAAGSGNGDVPLIRADTRPMKVKPSDPGGMKVPDRNMLVYGEARPTVERLLPPPEKPLPRPEPPQPAAAPAQPAPPAAAAAPAAVAAAVEPAPTPAPAPPPQEVAAPPRAQLPPATPPAVKPAPAAPEKPAAKSGGIRIQLGSLRSEDEARHEWDRLRHKNPDLLGKLSASTTRADLGDKGVYYRIMAGPVADPAAAERLCGELKQRSVGCIIAR